jgi:hypothetical protein
MIVLVFGALLAQAPVPLIDLVAEPPRYPKADGVSGGPAGGVIEGGSALPKPKLPLRIHLESIRPGQNPDRVIVQIVVENSGPEAYPLPVGRDGDLDLKPGNRGRRRFWYSLQAQRAKASYRGSGQSVFSSSDTPDSVMMVPAGGVARVRYSVDLWGAIRDPKRNGKTEIRLRAECGESRYLDDPERYIMDGWASPDPVLSDNEVTLPLP